jgi:hypothetical protein
VISYRSSASGQPGSEQLEITVTPASGNPRAIRRSQARAGDVTTT